MRSLSRRTAVVAALLVAATVSSGCSADRSGAPSPQRTTPTAADPSSTVSPTPTPSPTGPQLPRDCDRLIDYGAVLDAAGGVLEGESTFVYAGPLASGRTGRITCGYGVVAGLDGKPGPPKIEVTLNGYDSADTARFRLSFSISRAREKGQRIESIDLDSRPAVLISDAETASLVVLDDDKTLVVTIRRGVVPDPAIKAATFEIAAAVLGLPQAPTPTE